MLLHEHAQRIVIAAGVHAFGTTLTLGRIDEDTKVGGLFALLFVGFRMVPSRSVSTQ